MMWNVECSDNPLITVVRAKDLKEVENPTKDPTINVNSQDKDGRTALIRADWRYRPDIVAAILRVKDLDPKVDARMNETNPQHDRLFFE